MPTRVREQCQSPADADETPHCLQMHRTVPGTKPTTSALQHFRQLSKALLPSQDTAETANLHQPRADNPMQRFSFYEFAT